MCGVIGIFQVKNESKKYRGMALEMASRIRHRGPDWSGIYSDSNAIIAHERLSIVDVEHGAQPLYDKTTRSVLGVNGEIYNHLKLHSKLKKKHLWQTKPLKHRSRFWCRFHQLYPADPRPDRNINLNQPDVS